MSNTIQFKRGYEHDYTDFIGIVPLDNLAYVDKAINTYNGLVGKCVLRVSPEDQILNPETGHIEEGWVICRRHDCKEEDLSDFYTILQVLLNNKN